MFFRSHLKTNNTIVDYTVIFMFEFVIAFMFMAGELIIYDWVNNITITLLPSSISFMIGFVFMIIMLMKAFIFVAKEMKVLMR